jgi:hypothetical protein
MLISQEGKYKQTGKEEEEAGHTLKEVKVVLSLWSLLWPASSKHRRSWAL